jgi:hypothetical protein
VPLSRYFIFAGSVLIALLFIVDWVWPSSTPAPVQQASSQNPTNDISLRIQSEQKWPEKVVFDTSMPTIIPPPPVAIAATAPARPAISASAAPLEAHAEMKPDVQPVPPPKRQAKVHHRNPPAAAPPAWSWNW